MHRVVGVLRHPNYAENSIAEITDYGPVEAVVCVSADGVPSVWCSIFGSRAHIRERHLR